MESRLYTLATCGFGVRTSLEAKLPSFGGYSLETLPYLLSAWYTLLLSAVQPVYTLSAQIPCGYVTSLIRLQQSLSVTSTTHCHFVSDTIYLTIRLSMTRHKLIRLMTRLMVNPKLVNKQAICLHLHNSEET